MAAAWWYRQLAMLILITNPPSDQLPTPLFYKAMTFHCNLWSFDAIMTIINNHSEIALSGKCLIPLKTMLAGPELGFLWSDNFLNVIKCLPKCFSSILACNIMSDFHRISRQGQTHFGGSYTLISSTSLLSSSSLSTRSSIGSFSDRSKS